MRFTLLLPGLLLVAALVSACSASTGGPITSDAALDDTPALDGTAALDAPVSPDAVVRADGAPIVDAIVRPDGPRPPDAVDPPLDGETPIPCPGDLSGNGRRCASPGMGCGSAGPCGTVSCSCESDLRWRCEASGPGCPDGGPPDATVRPDVVAPPDAGLCALRGAWQIDIEGNTLYFVFGESTWGAGADRATVETMPLIGGTYAYSANRVTLREGRGMATGCEPAASGTYDVLWDPTCAGFTLREVVDDCSERAMTLTAVRFTR